MGVASGSYSFTQVHNDTHSDTLSTDSRSISSAISLDFLYPSVKSSDVDYVTDEHVPNTDNDVVLNHTDIITSSHVSENNSNNEDIENENSMSIDDSRPIIDDDNDGSEQCRSIPISFLHWNVNGLESKLTDNDFIHYIHAFDVIVLVETFIDNIHTNVFANFELWMRPGIKLSRQGRASGGMVVLVRKRLLPLIKKISCNCNHLNHMYFLFDKSLLNCQNDVLFVPTYIHPEGSPFYTHFDLEDGISCSEDCLTDILLSLDDVELLICGDINARIGTLSPEIVDNDEIFQCHNEANIYFQTRQSQDEIVNSYGRKFLQMCSIFNLFIFNGTCNGDLNGCYTYISESGNSVNDYFVASSYLYEFIVASDCNFYVDERIDSDHLPVVLSFNIHSNELVNSNFVNENNTEMIEKFVWKEESEEQFTRSMNDEQARERIREAESYIDLNVNLAIGIFNDFVKEIAEFLKKNIRLGVRKDDEWFDRECLTERRNVRRMLRIFRKNRNEENRHNYCKARREYKNLLKRKKKSFNDAIFDKLLESVNNQQSFWQAMVKLRCKKFQPKHNISMQQWYDHFKRLLDQDVGNHDDTLHIDDSYEEDLDRPISREEIIIALKKLKPRKSAGPDGMIGEFFKYSGILTINFLVKLFNKLFDEGIYPDDWVESIILPLYKKGDINNTNNYRGISLSNICSKLYGSIINNRLQHWVEKHDITGEHQAGFKKNHSTVDHIFTLLAAVQKQFSNTRNRKLYVAFVDFEKAFDTISRNILWPVLTKNGIRGKLLRCVKSMYSDVKARVRNGAKLSNLIDCTKGVKQGDVCSPILFSLFINELAIEIIEGGRHGVNFGVIEIFILLFADDLVLLSETVVGLQTQLNNLYRAATRLELKVNLSKTNIIVFRKGGYLAERERWYYGRDRINVVNTYKYLGIYFSTGLSFTFACQDLSARAKKAVVAILNSMRKFQNNSINILFKLFDAQVQPIIQYGAEIWGIDKGKDIEHVHLFAMKRFLFVSGTTPNNIIYGELGRYPLNVNTIIISIRYWLKVIQMGQHRLPSKSYKILFDLDQRGKVTWATSIRKCLSSYGFLTVWQNQGVGCVTTFLRCLKQRIIDCRWQDWHDELQHSDRYALYRLFKTNHCIEKYLYIDVNKYVKNALIKFRCGVSNISVHCYRHRINVNHRCRLCNLDTEDEIHFVLVCPCLSDIRSDLIPMKYYRNPSQFKLVLLLSSQAENVIKNLATFLYLAMKRIETVS